MKRLALVVLLASCATAKPGTSPRANDLYSACRAGCDANGGDVDFALVPAEDRWACICKARPPKA